MPKTTGSRVPAAGTNTDNVALSNNEVNADLLQTMVPEGNKTTYNPVSRSISSPDSPTGGDMTVTGFGASGTLAFIGNALNCEVRGTCSASGSTLAGFVALYDSSYNCIAKSTSFTLVSDATLRLGNGIGDYIANYVLLDTASATYAKPFITGISAGTWTIYCRGV